MIRKRLGGLLGGAAAMLAMLALAAAWGQSNRYPRGASGGLPSVGTPGTYTFASGGTITVDAQGRVTAVSPVSRTIATTAPLTGGGTIAADRTLACPTCLVGTLTNFNSALFAQNGTTAVFTDPKIFYAATGPTLNVQGLMKPWRIAGGSLGITAAPGVGTPLGTGPTCTVAGNDIDGSITLTTGTSPAAMTAGSFSTLCSLTFANAYSGGPRVVVYPANTAACTLESGSGVRAFVDPTSTTTTGFPIRIVSNTAPTLPASTALVYTYMVLQ